MKRALNFTMLDRDPPSTDKQNYGHTYAPNKRKRLLHSSMVVKKIVWHLEWENDYGESKDPIQ